MLLCNKITLIFLISLPRINPNKLPEGKKFSGGQIQRIAIARAIFQKRNFIILDETLNALDNENIVNVFNFLYKIPTVTILLIAHNDNVVKKCKKILKIENKQINEIKVS